jgi:hypothetical protein
MGTEDSIRRILGRPNTLMNPPWITTSTARITNHQRHLGINHIQQVDRMPESSHSLGRKIPMLQLIHDQPARLVVAVMAP